MCLSNEIFRIEIHIFNCFFHCFIFTFFFTIIIQLLSHINSLQFKYFFNYYIIYYTIFFFPICKNESKHSFCLSYHPCTNSHSIYHNLSTYKFPATQFEYFLCSYYFLFFLLQFAISNMEARVVPVTRFPPLPRVPMPRGLIDSNHRDYRIINCAVNRGRR